MPDNRIDIEISAQNRSRAAFQQARRDIQGTTQAVQGLNRELPRVRVGADSIKVFQDATGRFHDAVTGRWVSAQRVMAEGLTVIQRDSKGAAAGVDELNDQFRRGSGPARRYGGAIENVHGQLIALSVANRVIQRGIQATIVAQSREAITLERLNVGLQSLSSSYEEAAKQRERLIEASRLPGLNLEQALRSSLQLQAIGEDGERATRIITEFGNALALSGQSASELRPVISGLRQISGEGKVLQEDVGIITSRVAALGRGLRETFGGTRAEDIRRFYDALGVRGSEQGPRFIQDVLKILSELPRAGDTAANSIENLQDTFDRAQATIGQNFLPVIRELTEGLEELAQRVERDPGLARTIAQWETFLGVLGSTAFSVAGVGAALKILGPGALVALKSPLGLAALAVGALAGGLLTLKVRADEATPAQKNLERSAEGLAESYKTLADAQKAVTEAQQELNEATKDNVGVAAATAELAKAQTELKTAGETRIDALEGRAKALVESLAAEEERVKGLRQEYKELTGQIAELTEQSTFFGRFWERFTAGLVFGSNQGVLTPDAIEAVTSGNINTLNRAERRQGEVGEQLNVIAPAAQAIAENEYKGLIEQIDAYYRGLRQPRDVIGVRDTVTGARTALQNVAGGRRELPRVVPSGLSDEEADAFERSVEDTTQSLERFNETIDETARRLDPSRPQHIVRDILGRPDTSISPQGQAIGMTLPAPAGAYADLSSRNYGGASLEDQLAQRREQRETDEQRSVDAQLSLLANAAEQRQAQYDDDLRAQQQVEDDKQKKFAETYDFEQYLLGLRGARLKEGRARVARLQEQALDAESSRRIQIVQREVAQAIDEYSQLGTAYAGIVSELTAINQGLSQSLDEALATERLERFRDGLRDLIDDLGRTALDHLWDAFTSATDRASEALADYTYRVGEAQHSVSLLVSDVTRLNRLQEDAATRRERLGEDRDRRIAQLRRQQRTLAAQAPVGDQRALSQNIQRRQDISFRIAELREDFGVRIGRAQEDFLRNRGRLIEDAIVRRDRPREDLLDKLGGVIGRHVSDAIAGVIADEIAGLLTRTAFDAGVGLITKALGALGIGDLVDKIGDLFGSGDDGEGTGDGAGTGAGTGDGQADVTGTITSLALGADVVLPKIALPGTIDSVSPAATLTPTEIAVIGSLTSAVVSASYVPATLDVIGRITSLIVATPPPTATVDVVGRITSLIQANELQADSINVPAAVQFPEASALPKKDYSGAVQPITPTVALPGVGDLPKQDYSDAVSPIQVPINFPGVDDLPTVDYSDVLSPTTPDIQFPDASSFPPIDYSDAISPVNVPVDFPDFDLADPIDLGGLRFANIPIITIPFDFRLPGEGSTHDQGSSNGAGDGNPVLNEARERRHQQSRDAQLGTPQTNLTAADVEAGLINRAETPPRWFSDLPNQVADAIGRVFSTVLASGVGIGTGGSGAGDAAIDEVNAEVKNLNIDGSPRSDFVVTLPANVFTNQGNRDPDEDDDDEVAQAPAAVRFGSAADALNTEVNAISSELLSGISETIQTLADLPLIQQLARPGAIGLDEAPISLGAQSLELLGNLQALNALEPTPNLLGNSESNPLYTHVANQQETQKVEVTNTVKTEVTKGQVDANVTGTVQAEVTNVVPVRVGDVVRVFVEGGHVDIDVESLTREVYAHAVETELVGETSFGDL